MDLEDKVFIAFLIACVIGLCVYGYAVYMTMKTCRAPVHILSCGCGF